MENAKFEKKQKPTDHFVEMDISAAFGYGGSDILMLAAILKTLRQK